MIAIPPIDSPEMAQSISTFISYISGDPSRAAAFLFHSLTSSPAGSQLCIVHRAVAVISACPDETRAIVVDRFLRWCLNVSDPTVPQKGYCWLEWPFLKGFSALPELTNSRIRSAILAYPKDSYDLLVHLYTTNMNGIVAECPDLFADLSADVERLRALIADGTLELPAWVPLVRAGDSGTVRCIKFGGSMPHDPAAGYPLCPVCHVPVTHIMTLYVPLLPREVQEFFPDDERETVLVVGYCEQCWLEVPVQVFRGNEIDGLVMSANLGNHGRPCNEARVVVGWREEKSHPCGTGIEYMNLGGLKYRASSLWNDLMEKENEQAGEGTYAGGFPNYVQDREQPTEASRLLFELSYSEASTYMWGDCGTAQLWMETGEDYGKFQVTWACS
jgi:hypothetical protein